MGLKAYITRRLLECIPLFFSIVLLNFFLIHTAPGDPALVMAGERASVESIEEIRKAYGLDKPLYVQLTIYLASLLQGDLGYSFTYSRPVLSIIVERIPMTALLMISSEAFSLVTGILLGAYAARKRGSRVDNALSLMSLTMYSLPIFLLGIILILLFAVYLGMFPTSGMMTLGGKKMVGIEYLFDVLRHMFLPLVTLSLGLSIPQYFRLTRASILEVMHEDYITTSRAVGFDENAVFLKYALRNALLPVVTLAGISLGLVFTGALFTETVFGWPGMGRLMYDAIDMRDYPLIMGIFTTSSVTVLLATMLTDTVYAFLDPRVRYV